MDLRLLEHLAATGNAEAQYALGTAFLMGEGVPNNPERAADLFEKAAEQGNALAQCNLGAMYAQGISVRQDYTEARKWYAKSAAQGSPDGQYNLAVIYAQGLGGCKKDLNKARDLCRKAADQGQEKAKAMLPSLAGPVATSAEPEVSTNDRKTKARPEHQSKPNKQANGVSKEQPSAMESETKPRSESQSNGKPPQAQDLTGDTRVSSATQVWTQDQSGSPEAATASQAKNDSQSCTVVQEATKIGPWFATKKNVSFVPLEPVELKGLERPVVWKGMELESSFPKPGYSKAPPKLFLLKGLASKDEVDAILQVAQTSLEFNVDNDSVDGRPTYERYVVQVGQYVHAELEQILRPIIEDRILPYVRRKYNAPEATVCTVLIRRYLPDERRIHATHLDGHSFCTAVLGLNAGEFEGGLYVQPSSDAQQREFVNIETGDLAVHQFNLPHGVRVLSGRRYSIIFWIKDCIQSCVTNETPWYESAADAGDPDAMTALAQKLNKGMNSEGIGSDPVRAARWFKAAAELGHVEAQTHLGVFYETGRGGLPADGKEAVRWWTKAAEAGDSAAQRMLASAYSRGSCGLVRNDAKAVEWMTRAAKQDDWDAMYWLSMCHSRGLGTAVNPQEAMDWTVRAADMGHPEAQCALGAACLTGEGQDQNLEHAATWFRRAALNGNAAAQCNLGAFYAQGLGGLSQDMGEALYWYRVSAERGNADGQHNLALMYSQGLGGLPKDLQQARIWCEKASKQGQPKAMAMLSSLPPVSEQLQYHEDNTLKKDDKPHVGQDQRTAVQNAADVESSKMADPTTTSDEFFAGKVCEARSLLTEIRNQNASTLHACELLDKLLQQIDNNMAVKRPSVLPKSESRSPVMDATVENMMGGPGATAHVARRIDAVDAVDYRDDELLQICQGRSEPLLVQNAALVKQDTMSEVCQVVGEDAVCWEAQGGTGSPRCIEGSFQGFWEVACQGLEGSGVLMLDGTILQSPSLREIVDVPTFLSDSDVVEKLPAELRPARRHWLTAGSKRSKSQLHRDPPWLGWYKCLHGSVEWRLLPPDTKNIVRMPVGSCGAEVSDGDAFVRDDAWLARQAPGDVLLVPRGWWRQLSCASGPAAIIASQTVEESSLADMLQALQRAARIPEVQLTGYPDADIRLVAGILCGHELEKPDRRAMLRSTRTRWPTMATVQPLQNLPSAEFID